MIDFRIVSRPYRGARRFMVMKNGFATRQKAEQYLEHAQREGWLAPDAYVRSQKVNTLKPVDCTVDIRTAAGGTLPPP